MTGKTISHYRILSKIGAGGMGVVYKAEDTRLHRTVAVKILPEERITSPELRQRFEREAQAISSLNHPHICTLYDVGHVDGSDYLVMEYLEGKALKGPMPVEEALELAVQIADALHHAHRHGIIHRDIKPGNVIITKRGAKLLDFSLARLVPAPEARAEDSSTEDLTRKGEIIGTLRFMSPEQWEGKEADARSDIFAFGALVFEMLTGRKAFTGKSRASLIAAIMRTDPPPVSSIDSLLPPALDHIITKCLEKDPDRRWQTAADLRDELQWIVEATPTQAFLPVPPVVRRRMRMMKRTILALSASLIVAAVIVGVLAGIWFFRPAAEPPLRKLALMPEDLSDYSLQVSPDGKHIAYLAGEPVRLWIQSLARRQPQESEATEGARYPFWSPASDFICFAQGSELKKASVSGGPAVTICQLPGASDFFFTGAWRPDGESIVFSSGIPHRLYEVSAHGGPPALLIDPKEADYGKTIAFPQFLPVGEPSRTLLYFMGAVNEGEIVVHDLETDEQKVLTAGGPFTYSPSGHILYQPTRDDASILFALPFSLDTLQPSGEAFPIAENAAYPSVSSDGTLVYLDTGGRVQWQLVWRGRDGESLGTFGQPQRFMWDPDLSPDDTRVAVAAIEEERDIWVHELNRPVKVTLTFDSEPDYAPIWSSSGKDVTFTSLREDGREIFVKSSDGTGESKMLSAGTTAHLVSDWSPDGKYLVYSRIDPERGRDLWYLRPKAEGDGYESVPFLQSPFNEEAAKFSPDGRFVVYVSDESRHYEVYIRRFPDGEGKWRVSGRGGSQPRWSRDGKEIFYVEGQTLMSVPVNTAGSLSLGAPARLFRSAGFRASFTYAPQYDVAADGQHFVTIEKAGDPPKPVIRVVQNWFAEFQNR